MMHQRLHRIGSPVKVLMTGIICMGVLLSSCENSRSEIEQFSKKNTGIEVARDVNILYSVGDKTKSRINSPLMLRHVESTPYIEFPKNIYADFFDDSLRVESRLSAHYAEYFENESKVFLRDSVVVMNNKGDTLFCQELYWDRNKPGREFYTDKPVRIRTLTQIIDGDGLDAPQDFKSWHIVNGRGFVRVSEADLP